jgi:membrane protease YdiL (CAAX protease family)
MAEAANVDHATPVVPPRWHVLVLLIAFPLAYWLNGLMPWSYQFFVKRDHSYFIPFGAAVCLLHWASACFALWSLRKIGARPRDIGLHISAGRIVVLVATVVAIGAALIAARQRWPIHTVPPSDFTFFYPFTRAERCFFVFMALSAGICEEIVYRGYAITALQGRGWRTWQAVVLAAISFVFMHGIASLFLFPFLIVVGLVYGCLFLWCKSLTPLIWLHCLFDLMAVVAI